MEDVPINFCVVLCKGDYMDTKEVLKHYINKRVYFSTWADEWSLRHVYKNEMQRWYNEARRLWKVPLTYDDFERKVASGRYDSYVPWGFRSFHWHRQEGRS